MTTRYTGTTYTVMDRLYCLAVLCLFRIRISFYFYAAVAEIQMIYYTCIYDVSYYAFAVFVHAT